MKNSKELIKNYLVNNREHIIELITPYIEQRDSLVKETQNEFKKDIESQFVYTCKQQIVFEISNAKLEGISVEDIIIDVGALDLNYYINAEVIDA